MLRQIVSFSNCLLGNHAPVWKKEVKPGYTYVHQLTGKCKYCSHVTTHPDHADVYRFNDVVDGKLVPKV